jgi:hypothetical protein
METGEIHSWLGDQGGQPGHAVNEHRVMLFNNPVEKGLLGSMAPVTANRILVKKYGQTLRDPHKFFRISIVSPYPVGQA